MSPPPAAAAPPQPPEPTVAVWLGFACMALGNFMAILDVQIVASSLREIQAGVAASSDELVWIQTSYLVAEIIAIPLSGFLGRAVSIRNLFAFAAAGFTLASLGCALSDSIGMLVGFRIVQGLMGGFMMPTTFAAGFLLFPERHRATVNVLMGLIMTTAPAMGPALGGFITSTFGWHWLFLVNIVPGLVCCAGVALLIPLRTPDWALLRRIDLPGLVGMAAMLGALQIVLEEGPRQGWLASGEVAAWSMVAGLGGLLFFWRAFTREEPIVKLDAFANRNFAVCALLAFTVGIGLYGSVYLQPLFLGQVRGYSAMQVGEIMFVTGVFMFLTAPFARQVIIRTDPRLPLLFGICMIAGSCIAQAHLTHESSFPDFFWPQAMRGVGLIFCFATLSIVALGTLPAHQIQSASGLFNLTRNLGGAMGLAMLSTLNDHFTVFHRTALAPALNPGDPTVQARLAEASARMAAAGVADPERAALATLIAPLHRDAAVMTFNNLFWVIAFSLLAALPVLVFVQRPKPAAAPTDAH